MMEERRQATYVERALVDQLCFPHAPRRWTASRGSRGVKRGQDASSNASACCCPPDAPMPLAPLIGHVPPSACTTVGQALRAYVGRAARQGEERHLLRSRCVHHPSRRRTPGLRLAAACGPCGCTAGGTEWRRVTMRRSSLRTPPGLLASVKRCGWRQHQHRRAQARNGVLSRGFARESRWTCPALTRGAGTRQERSVQRVQRQHLHRSCWRLRERVAEGHPPSAAAV